jgi:hypothetical protein
MADIVTDKVKDKIRKLLALSESNNANEAASAMERARALLLQYNLDMGELEIKSSIVEDVYDQGGGEHDYETSLIYSVALYNLCTMYTAHQQFWQNHRRHSSFQRVLVGQQQNIASTRVMVDYVFDVLERGAKRVKGMGRIEVASYKKAFCLTLAVRIRNMIEEAKIKENAECRALVVVATAEVDKYMNEKEGMTVSKGKINTDVKGFLGGILGGQDAMAVSLNGQIDQKKGNLQAIGA